MDSNTPQKPQLFSLMTSPPAEPAPGTLVPETAQACVLLTSTWELRTVNHATTPASTDALTATHVPTTLVTLTVPHVAAQDPTSVPHATVTQTSLMVSSTTHVTVTLIIISLMDTVPLVDKTVTTATSTVALSVTLDSTTTTLKPSVSTSAQLAQSTTPPATVDHA